MIGGAGVNNAGEPPFEIRGFSLGNLVIGGGIIVTILSFAEYLSNSGGDGLNVSGLGFVYGIPITLAGAALKYAEIDPVPCITGTRGYIIPIDVRTVDAQPFRRKQKMGWVSLVPLKVCLRSMFTLHQDIGYIMFLGPR